MDETMKLVTPAKAIREISHWLGKSADKKCSSDYALRQIALIVLSADLSKDESE